MSAVPQAEPASSATTHRLYEQYGKQIYAYCYQRLRSREEAEDAVQTTFLNAFRALQRGTVTEFQQAWLFKIAQNVCLERSEASGRRAKLESPSDLQVIQETAPAPAAQDSDQLIGVEGALQRIPANQRKAILLREWQGLSYREIGEELGLSQSAVEMLIFRARRSLAAALEQPGQAQEAPQRRLARGGAFNVSSLATALQSLIAGGGAVKATALAVTAGAAMISIGAPASHTVVRHGGIVVAHSAPIAAVAAAPAPAVAPLVVPKPIRLAPAVVHRPARHVPHGAPPVVHVFVAPHPHPTPAPPPAPVAAPPAAPKPKPAPPAPVAVAPAAPPAVVPTPAAAPAAAPAPPPPPPPPATDGGGSPPPTPPVDGGPGQGEGTGDPGSGSGDGGQTPGDGGGDPGQGQGGGEGNGNGDGGDHGQGSGQGQGQGHGRGGDGGNGNGGGQGHGHGH